MAGLDDQPNEIIHAVAFGAGVLTAADVASLRAASRRAASAIRAEGLDLVQWRACLGAEECARRGYEKAALLALDRAGLFLPSRTPPSLTDPPPEKPPLAGTYTRAFHSWAKKIDAWTILRAHLLEVGLAKLAFQNGLAQLLARIAPWMYPAELLRYFKRKRVTSKIVRMFYGARACRTFVARAERAPLRDRLFSFAFRHADRGLLGVLLEDFPLEKGLFKRMRRIKKVGRTVVYGDPRVGDPGMLDTCLEQGRFGCLRAECEFIDFACRVKRAGEEQIRRILAHPKMAAAVASDSDSVLFPGEPTLATVVRFAAPAAREVIQEEMWKDTARYAPYLLPVEASQGHVEGVAALLEDPRADLFRKRPTWIAALYGQAGALALLLADERAAVDERALKLAINPHRWTSLEQMEAVLDLLLGDPRIL
jgi:hypothetical protein